MRNSIARDRLKPVRDLIWGMSVNLRYWKSQPFTDSKLLAQKIFLSIWGGGDNLNHSFFIKIREKAMIRKRIRLLKDYIDHKNLVLNENVLIFLHIPKCAGMSFKETLKSNYNSWRFLDYHMKEGRHDKLGNPITFNSRNSDDIEFLINYIKRKHSSLECISGHIPYGIHDFIERDCKYVSIIREPIKRIWSSLNYEMQRDDIKKPMIAVFGNDLQNISEKDPDFVFSNDQSRMLLGSSETNIHIDCFDKLVQHLNQSYYYVDILERLETTLNFLQRDCNWKHLVRSNKNAGDYRSHPKIPPNDIKDFIKHHNQLDIALYEYIKKNGPCGTYNRSNK